MRSQHPWFLGMIGLMATLFGGVQPGIAQYNQNLSNPNFRGGTQGNNSAGLNAPAGRLNSQNRYTAPPQVAPTDPYGGGGGYGFPWARPFIDPYGSTLQGAASVMNAQGQYLNQRQEALLRQEDVKNAKLDRRRRIIDEYLYEKEVLPNDEQLREEKRRLRVQRAKNNPPETEVWSGYALNTLLRDMEQLHGRGIRGPNVPLDQEMLQHISISSIGSPTGRGGNLGLLKDGGKLEWPLSLQNPIFDKYRDNLETAFGAAVEDAKRGEIKFQTLQSLQATANTFQEALKKQVNNISGNDYIEGRHYLNLVDDSVKAMRDRNMLNLVKNDVMSPQGRNVAELVDFMGSKGLEFSPAVPGEETSYSALHRAMASYDRAMEYMVASQQAANQRQQQQRRQR